MSIGAPWDTKTGIWSLGVVIFETLSDYKIALVAETHEIIHSYFTTEEQTRMEKQRQKERKRRWQVGLLLLFPSNPLLNLVPNLTSISIDSWRFGLLKLPGVYRY